MFDLYCTNKPSLTKLISVISRISDHDSDNKTQLAKKEKRKVNLFNKADWGKYAKKTSAFTTHFLNKIAQSTVEHNWQLIKKHISQTISNLVPRKTTSCRYNLPWVIPKLRRMCRKKQRLHNKARKSGKSQDWSAFIEVKKSIKKCLNTAHRDYINNILSDSLNNNNSMSFWNYIEAKKQDNVRISPLKRDGVLFNDTIDKAKILNAQFTSVFTKEDGNAIPTLKNKKFTSIDLTIDDLTITPEGIENLLRDLKPNKASGPDCVPARFLKEMATELAPALSAFFTQSLNESTLPNDWTQANSTPIYKKDSRYQTENYYKGLFPLTVLQHSFRRARSCESQLLVTIHHMLNYWNKNTQLDVIVLDFSWAFDTAPAPSSLPHDRLLGKLAHYGINGHIHSWISNFRETQEPVCTCGWGEVRPCARGLRCTTGDCHGWDHYCFSCIVTTHLKMAPLRSGCLQMTPVPTYSHC